ncbi:IS21-like element helper ATPase IstB [Vibrio sp. nBUS_14]|uniref:IS21-like element helper ATPase IstB n=1 Tax=Vibrio sp. nBUS_14 TaxID=3395321 RepID=UPI003EBC7DDA
MDAIIQQLKSLRLSHASDALEQQRIHPATYAELGFEERLGLILDHEIVNRDQTKIQRLKRQAKLRLSASGNQLDYRPERGLKRAMMGELLSGTYLQKRQNVLITGATGAGKTYVACALAEQACEQHCPSRYYRLNRLLDDLSSSRLDGSYQKLLLSLSKKKLLVIDDRGMEKLSQEHASNLLEVLEDRYQECSTIIISQLPVKEWHEMIDNSTIADAILDRLVHQSHRIELRGESMRKLA